METGEAQRWTRTRRRAARASLVIGVLLLATKFVAWGLTGSTAILSDALESIVNVVAAGFALFSVGLSDRPPDVRHPYGYGKIEFLAAGFEGGLVALAGLLIVFESVRRLLVGAPLENLSAGLWLTAGAAGVNAVTGLWLVRVGRRTDSLVLVSDGRHLLTDVWTSAMAVVALFAVLVTGWTVLDPLVALLAAANVFRVGISLLRQAVGGIMDVADPRDLRIVGKALEAFEDPLFAGWAKLRSRHQGRVHQVDLVVYVRDEAPVRAAHRLADRVEAQVRAALGEAEVICHVEPESMRGADPTSAVR